MTSLNTSTSALDFAQIAQLKATQRPMSPQRERSRATVESIFINMMLQSMRIQNALG